MDNATNNESFHKSLFYDYLNKIKPSGHQMLGKVRFIRCANQVLNLIFGRIKKSLCEDLLFAESFSKVTKLAKIMRHSTAVNASLKEHGIPLIPYESQTRWIYTWRQVTGFLQNYPAYPEWFKALDTKSHSHIINRVYSVIGFDEKTIQMLIHFLKCCDIFAKLNFTFQNDEFNNLPQGVPLLPTRSLLQTVLECFCRKPYSKKLQAWITFISTAGSLYLWMIKELFFKQLKIPTAAIKTTYRIST